MRKEIDKLGPLCSIPVTINQFECIIFEIITYYKRFLISALQSFAGCPANEEQSETESATEFDDLLGAISLRVAL